MTIAASGLVAGQQQPIDEGQTDVVEAVSVSSAPINASDAGTEQTVTIRFANETNATGVETVALVIEDSERVVPVDGDGTATETTWTGRVTIPDEAMDTTACVAVAMRGTGNGANENESDDSEDSPHEGGGFKEGDGGSGADGTESDQGTDRRAAGELACVGPVEIDTEASLTVFEPETPVRGTVDVTDLVETEPDAQVEYDYDSGGETGPVETPTAFDTTQFENGPVTITVTATDDAGNTDAANLTLTVDDTAPTVESFDATVTRAGAGATLDVSLVVDERLDGFRIAVDGPDGAEPLPADEFEEFERPGGVEYRLETPLHPGEGPSGTVTFAVERIRDRAGNVNASVSASAKMTVDLQAPKIRQRAVTDRNDTDGVVDGGDRLEVATVLDGETDDLTAVTADTSPIGPSAVTLEPVEPGDLNATTTAKLQRRPMTLIFRPKPYAGTVTDTPVFEVRVDGAVRRTVELTGVDNYDPDLPAPTYEREVRLALDAGDEVSIVPAVPAGNYEVEATVAGPTHQHESGTTGRDSDGSVGSVFEFEVEHEADPAATPRLANETIYAGEVRVPDRTPDGEVRVNLTAVDDANNSDVAQTRSLVVDTAEPQLTDAYVLQALRPLHPDPFERKQPGPVLGPEERDEREEPVPPEMPVRTVIVAETSEPVIDIDRSAIHVEGVDDGRILEATAVERVPPERPVGPPGRLLPHPEGELGELRPKDEPTRRGGDVILLSVRGVVPTGDEPKVTFDEGAVTEARPAHDPNERTSTTLHSARLDLAAGKNLVSVPAVAGSLPLADVDTEHVEGVWTYDDGEWLSWTPAARENDFDRLEGGQGYVFVMAENDTLDVSVRTVAAPDNRTVQRLESGWNLVGHYGHLDVPPVLAFGSLYDEGLDEDPERAWPHPVTGLYGPVNWRGGPGPRLVEFAPHEPWVRTGQGYWLHLAEPTNDTRAAYAPFEALTGPGTDEKPEISGGAPS